MAQIPVTSNPFEVAGDKGGNVLLRQKAKGNVPAGLLATLPLAARARAGSFTTTRPGYPRIGVYTQDGIKLVRSLPVSRTPTPAGIITPEWDGVGDDGVLHDVNDGYVFLPFWHAQDDSVAATFKGVIGNTSTSGGTGPTAWSGYNPPVAGAYAKGRRFFCTGFAENSPNLCTTAPNDPNTIQLVHKISNLSGTHMCTDGELIYVAGIFIMGSYNGNISGRGVIAIDAATLQDYVFPSGQTLVYQTHTYNAIDILAGGAFTLGLAVQRTGNFLFVCHELGNEISVYHKRTGEFIRSMPVNQPRWCAVLEDGRLCLVHDDNTTEFYTINADGTLTSQNVVLAGLTQAGCMAYKRGANEIHVLDVAENTLRFWGNDAANSGSEELIPQKIYSFHLRAMRYVGPAGARLSAAGWDAIDPATNPNWVLLPSLVPTTAHHRRRVYDATTGAHLRDHGRGDYRTDPIGVTPDKFFFGDCENFKDDGDSCFIMFEDDGSSWIGDGMKRVSKFDTNEVYQTQIAYTGSTYNLAGHAKKAWQGWDNMLLYKRNYAVALGPTNGSWEMYGNYSCFVLTETGTMQRNLTTAKDGHDYTLLREGYKWRIWELTDTTFTPTNVYTQDLGSCLDKSGDIWDVNGYDVGGRQEYPQRVLTGRDAGGNPQYAAPVVEYWINSVGLNDPFCAGLGQGLADDGTLLVYDVGANSTDEGRQGKDSFHVGGVRKGTGTWAFRTAHATHRTYQGEQPYGPFFDTGNNVGYAGSFYVVVGSFIIVGFRGEFWKNGQCNTYRCYNSKGVFMFQFGDDRDGALSYEVAQAGQGGSGLTGWAVNAEGKLYFYVGTEGNGPSGPNEWAFEDFLTTYTEYPAIPVTVLTPRRVVATNPLVGLPYDSAIQNGRNGLIMRGNVSAYTGIETLDQAAPDITFHITAGGAVGDLGSVDVPLLRGSDDALDNWRYSSKLAWKSLYADDAYHDATDELLDDAGNILFRLTYVQRKVSDTENDFVLLANGNVRPPGSGSPVDRGGVVLSALEATVQVYNTLYLRDYVVQRQGNKLLVSTNNSPAVLVDLFDPAANINRPTTRRFKYNSYSGGDWKVAIYALEFTPSPT